jgi:hypothetical protein
VLWNRQSALATGRHSWSVALAVVMVAGALMVLTGYNSAALFALISPRISWPTFRRSADNGAAPLPAPARGRRSVAGSPAAAGPSAGGRHRR